MTNTQYDFRLIWSGRDRGVPMQKVSIYICYTTIFIGP